MKNIIVLLVLILMRTHLAQFYYPNGKEIIGDSLSIESVAEDMGYPVYTFDAYDNSVVVLKPLTDIPLFVLTLEKKSAIKSIFSKFNYKKYLTSYQYYTEIRKFIDEGFLNSAYLYANYKEPTTLYVNENGDSCATWYDRNLSIDHYNNTIKGFTVADYNMIFRKHKFAVLEQKVIGDDYSIGFRISVMNISEKRIKYLHIAVSIYNAVEDWIADKTTKAIGPIESNESAVYIFENVLYSKVAHSLRIKSIKIEYFGGAVLTIPGKDLEKLHYPLYKN